jgi:hypothetical protein
MEKADENIRLNKQKYNHLFWATTLLTNFLHRLTKTSWLKSLVNGRVLVKLESLMIKPTHRKKVNLEYIEHEIEDWSKDKKPRLWQ